MTARRRAIAIIVAVFVLDRATKFYIQDAFSPLDMLEVIPGVFNIVHYENPGAAWGILGSAPETLRRLVLVGLSVVIMAVIGTMLFRRRSPEESKITQTGLAMVLGGALGNLWDRALRGTVTDFLQVFLGSYEYPSFNVADSAIFIGACLLILDMLRNRRTSTK
jgi:signal peptidase II